MPSTTKEGRTRAGLRRLERHWAVPAPRAAMLLVHGISEHSGRYEHVGDFFAAGGIDTLSFDLQGHGRSDGRRSHIDTFDTFLDDIEDLLAERRRLGVPVVLLGHSLGGLLCSTYAARSRPAPDLLVLSAPALRPEVPWVVQVVTPLLGRVWPTLRAPNRIDAALLSRDETVTEAYRTDPLRDEWVTARLGAEILAAMDDTSARLDQITVATYVLHGADDMVVRPAATEGFEPLANVTRIVHAGLRHECFNEPEHPEVLAAVLSWIDGRLSSLGVGGAGTPTVVRPD